MANSFNLDKDGIHVKNGVLVKYNEDEANHPKSIKLLKKVEEIDKKAFLQNDNQEGTISLEEVSCSCTVLRSHAFFKCKSIKNFTSPSIEVLENAAFSGCTSLCNFPNLSDNINVIPSYCFNDCAELTDVHLPMSTTLIEVGAFSNTFKLRQVEWSPDLEVIGLDAFYNSGLSGELTLPKRLKFIGANAFAKCDEVTSIRLPKSIISINETAFKDMDNVETIYVPEGFEVPESLWGLDKDKVKVVIAKESIEIANDSNVEEDDSSIDDSNVTNENGFTIKNGVLIHFTPYECNEDFNDLHVPEGVTEIGEDAFRQCEDGEDDFCGVKGLFKVTLPTTCTVLRAGAFYSCQNLREVKCLAKLETVEYAAFSDCNSLEFCVGVPKTQDFIPDHLYDRCGITVVRFPNHVKTIGFSAFYDVVNLEDLRLNKVEVIEPEAFFHCSLRQGLILPETVKEVQSEAFRWARPPFIRINSLDTMIAGDAFEGIETVKEIYVPKGFEVPEDLWGIKNPEDVEIIEMEQ